MIKILSVQNYNSHAFLGDDGSFAKLWISDNGKETSVELKKRKHLCYFEYEGVRYLVHNVGHLIAPKFELVA